MSQKNNTRTVTTGIKRAVILHGTSSSPDSAWKPWLKKELEDRGYEVWSPLLPNNDVPNRFTYDQFLRHSGWDFTDNILIGHSSDATTILNLLSSDWVPDIKAAVLVGTHLNDKHIKAVNHDWYTPGMFKENFPPEGFDFPKITQRARHFYFVHGALDPLCDPEDARAVCDALGGTFVSVIGGGHFSSPTMEIPELLAVLEAHKEL